MFKNYLKIAWRNLIRYKAFSAINIIGLAIGMMCSILIMLWVQNEKSYDRFHENAETIYRITASLSGLDAAVVPAVLAPELKEKLPAIKNMTRISYPEKQIMEIGADKFFEEKALYVGFTFFQIFSFPLEKGNKAKVFSRPDGIVITHEIAKKYFGNEDAMGKVIRINNSRNVVVTGVLKTLPANSHLQFNFLMPISAIAHTNEDLKNGSWVNFSFYAYLQLHKNVLPSRQNIAALEKQINDIFKKHVSENEMTAKCQLQPLVNIHLGSHFQGDFAGHGNQFYVNIFSIVAIFVLAVACINFMNLATARSARRAKEVGLRKTVGAGHTQLIIQFLSESLLISFIALFIAISLVWLTMPLFNTLTGKQIIVSFFNWKMISLFGSIALLTGLISGSYPALFLSRFKPIKVLKGETKNTGGINFFRNGLVVLQFVVSIMLLAGTIIVYQQLGFIKNMNLGFEKSNLVYMPMMGDLYYKKDAVTAVLQGNTLTNDFTITDGGLPIDLLNASDVVDWDGKAPNQNTIFGHIAVDGTFIDVMGMKLLNGRAFYKDSKADSNNYIINETAAKVMGMTAQNAIGKQITQWSVKGTVIGVVKDFNFKPVQQPVEPLIMRYNPNAGMVIVRAKPGTTESTVKTLEKINTTLNPSTPFSFGFIDQDLANLYKGEQQMGKLFNIFTILALFISCLGLYGLSAFIAEQRTKEIGVRKILGASVFNIIRLLSLNFIKIVLVAIIAAIPLSWLAITKWLDSFAYRVNVDWIVFAIASLASLLVALLTVSFESMKAATVNPVESLRRE